MSETSSRPIKGGRWRKVFLAALAEGASPTKAAAAAKVSRTTAYVHRRADAAFRKAWDDAYEQGGDKISDEIWRRAVEGVEVPIVRHGKTVGYLREYSDRLLELEAKRRKPAEYRERVDVHQTGKVPAGEMSPAVSKLIDKVTERLTDRGASAPAPVGADDRARVDEGDVPKSDARDETKTVH